MIDVKKMRAEFLKRLMSTGLKHCVPHAAMDEIEQHFYELTEPLKL